MNNLDKIANHPQILAALVEAMIGPTSGGIARQLAPVILAAILAGKIPGVRADQ
jgi:hypothetical protein